MDDVKPDITVTCNDILKEAIKKINRKISKLKAVDITVEDVEKINYIKETIKSIEERIK